MSLRKYETIPCFAELNETKSPSRKKKIGMGRARKDGKEHIKESFSSQSLSACASHSFPGLDRVVLEESVEDRC